MMLKTCKWYQTVCLVMARRLVPSVTLLGQLLKLTYLDHYVCTMLFVMTFGDLNIDLTQKVFYNSCRSFNELSAAPFVVCRYNSFFFLDLTGGGGEKASRPIQSLSEPAWNRVNDG